MNIEPGSEWVHLETLIAIVVREVNPHAVWFRHPLTKHKYTERVDKTDFLRDYAPNEPVTLALLERMGWRCRFSHRGPELFITGRFVIQFIDGRLTTYDDEDQPVPLGPESPTLRDLLTVLRVFGVSCPIPEPVK